MVVLMLPLMLLNIAGGVASGIWLAVLGEWRVVGLGAATGLFGHIPLGLLIGLGMALFGGPGIALENKGKKAGVLVFAILSTLFVASLISAWCMGVLALFIRMTASDALIPTVIWSYGVATGPWAFLAQKDQEGGGNVFSATGTFFAEIAFVVVGLVIILGRPMFRNMILLFASIMAVSVIIGIAFAIRELFDKQQSRMMP